MYCYDPCSMNYCAPNHCAQPTNLLMAQSPRYSCAAVGEPVSKKATALKQTKSTGSKKYKKLAAKAYAQNMTSPQNAAERLKSRSNRSIENRSKDNRASMSSIQEESEDDFCNNSDEQIKKIKESCENFLGVVHDNVLEIVQECIQKLMGKFCAIQAQIDNVSSQLNRNECLISNMHMDFMEKLALQNDRTNSQFKCVCQLLHERLDTLPNANPTRQEAGTAHICKKNPFYIPPPVGNSRHKVKSTKHIPNASSIHQHHSQTRSSMNHVQVHSQHQQSALPKTIVCSGRHKRECTGSHFASKNCSKHRH